VKILVADVPEMDARYTAAFGGWEVSFVRTVAEARKLLAAAQHDLVAIGVYFDDSRMFDLVRVLRADRKYATVPIVCVRSRVGFMNVSTETLETTAKALGADVFLDLVHFADDHSTNQALRGAVELLRA
jgi:response regulator of citrate/malate metabolism